MSNGKKEAEEVTEKKELSKEQRIKREVTRLRRVFKDLDKNALQVVEPLIKSAAFMTVTLADLELTISEEGCISEYKNGENQFGLKKSAAFDAYTSTIKNYMAAIKQIIEIAPDGTGSDELSNFMVGK